MNIQFTTEEKEEGHLPILDIHIYRLPGGSVGLSLVGKPPVSVFIYTGIHFYLHRDSLHHPTSNQSVLASLIHKARALCD